MAKCNLPEELCGEYLRREENWRHDDGELEKCRIFFRNYIFSDRAEDYADGYNDYMAKHGKEKIFRCSTCREIFTLSKKEKSPIFEAKHGQTVRCPHCNEDAWIETLGKIRSGKSLRQSTAVSFINVNERGAVCIESGIVFYEFNGERDARYAEMEISFIAKRRYYIEQGLCQGWRRSIGTMFWRELYGASEWEKTVNITEPFAESHLYGYDGSGYCIGLEKLGKSQLKYSAIDMYYRDYHNIDIYESKALVWLMPQYLAEYALNNRIEMAVKLGLSEAVGELVRFGRKNSRYIDWKASRPEEFVRMSKEDAKEFFRAASLECLKWFREMKRLGAVKSFLEAERIVAKVGMMSPEAAGYAVKYGIKVSTLAARMKDSVRLETWKDYVSMGETMGLDFSREDVLFPKELQRRHDELARSIEIAGNEEKNKAYQKRRRKLEERYGFTMGGLTIVVPSSIEEIVAEGKTLKICVGGYANRHVEGKTTILFLRHERRPERSFLCIEVDKEGKIAQIHGYRNENYNKNSGTRISMRKKYAWFLGPWQEFYKNGSRRTGKGKAIISEKRTSA